MTVVVGNSMNLLPMPDKCRPVSFAVSLSVLDTELYCRPTLCTFTLWKEQMKQMMRTINATSTALAPEKKDQHLSLSPYLLF